MILNIHFEDKDTLLDTDQITVSEWKVIKSVCGLNPGGFFQAALGQELEPLQAFFWLLRKRQGVMVDAETADFGVLGLWRAITDAVQAFNARQESDKQDEAPKVAET